MIGAEIERSFQRRDFFSNMLKIDGNLSIALRSGLDGIRSVILLINILRLSRQTFGTLRLPTGVFSLSDPFSANCAIVGYSGME
jgi:hypothetical protein